MKRILVYFLLATGVSMVSCDRNDPKPDKETVILPLRLELDDYRREFTFDAQNRVSKVRNISFFVGGTQLESIIEYFYSSDNLLEKTVTDSGFELEYLYEGGRIVRTNEYINGELSQYHTFGYDDKGRLHEFITWQEIPETGLTPKAKEVYLYDSNDNLSFQFLYYYDTGINGHTLLTSFEYSDYDNYREAESRFDAHAFNPLAALKKNNAGKMITRNRQGNIGMIDTYNYVYDARGNVTEKTTTTTYSYNGSTGSYKTYFFYQER